MVKIIICVLSGLLLVGCNFTKPETKIIYQKIYVDVPVVPAKPPVYEKIDIPLFHLDSKDPKIISEAYYNSIIILLGEVKKRDLDLNVYRNFEIKKEGE